MKPEQVRDFIRKGLDAQLSIDTQVDEATRILVRRKTEEFLLKLPRDILPDPLLFDVEARDGENGAMSIAITIKNAPPKLAMLLGAEFFCVNCGVSQRTAPGAGYEMRNEQGEVGWMCNPCKRALEQP